MVLVDVPPACESLREAALQLEQHRPRPTLELALRRDKVRRVRDQRVEPPALRPRRPAILALAPREVAEHELAQELGGFFPRPRVVTRPGRLAGEAELGGALAELLRQRAQQQLELVVPHDRDLRRVRRLD